MHGEQRCVTRLRTAPTISAIYKEVVASKRPIAGVVHVASKDSVGYESLGIEVEPYGEPHRVL
jgi:hypothetical protein